MTVAWGLAFHPDCACELAVSRFQPYQPGIVPGGDPYLRPVEFAEGVQHAGVGEDGGGGLGGTADGGRGECAHRPCQGDS